VCEFCHQHGEGQKWYLNTKNYSNDLLSDARRQKLISNFPALTKQLVKDEKTFERVVHLPALVRAIAMPYIQNKKKDQHFGQVVPIEDLDRILEFSNSIIRLPCSCREELSGPDKYRYCYGFLITPQGQNTFGDLALPVDKSYNAGPDTSEFETMSKEEAKIALRDLEKKGLCHTIWTFITPFIGGICNCDRTDCLAMRATVSIGFPTMFRAEYVAEVNPELCSGCRRCMLICQFGAIGYSALNEKAVIDQRRCYGCGVCRANCPKNAIVLKDRSSVPVAANLW
jgi:ferredoxin